MNTAKISVNLADKYFGLLKNLSSDTKLELIHLLSESINSKKKAKGETLRSLYGAFVSEQSAEELINELKKARTFKANRIEF